jgi:flavodoxin
VRKLAENVKIPVEVMTMVITGQMPVTAYVANKIEAGMNKLNLTVTYHPYNASKDICKPIFKDSLHMQKAIQSINMRKKAEKIKLKDLVDKKSDEDEAKEVADMLVASLEESVPETTVDPLTTSDDEENISRVVHYENCIHNAQEAFEYPDEEDDPYFNEAFEVEIVGEGPKILGNINDEDFDIDKIPMHGDIIVNGRDGDGNVDKKNQSKQVLDLVKGIDDIEFLDKLAKYCSARAEMLRCEQDIF